MPDGYVHGAAAATEATGLALAKVPDPAVLLLVEGVSDQIAVERLAQRRGDRLGDRRIAVVPIGGAQAVARFVGEHPRVPAVALGDAAERAHFLRVLPAGDVFVCEPDLEGELIRAVGAEQVLSIVAAQGELRRLRTRQRQAAWTDVPLDEQLRGLIATRARSKHRYAQLLVDAACDAGNVPAPLAAVLAAALSRAGRAARPRPTA